MPARIVKNTLIREIFSLLSSFAIHCAIVGLYMATSSSVAARMHRHGAVEVVLGGSGLEGNAQKLRHLASIRPHDVRAQNLAALASTTSFISVFQLRAGERVLGD